MRRLALLLMVLACLELPAATAEATTSWRTTSTMYCLKGGTPRGVAVSIPNFRRLHHTEWTVIREDKPRWAKRGNLVLGKTFVVADKGPKAHFDMWTSDCRLAREYGGRTITLHLVCYRIPENPPC